MSRTPEICIFYNKLSGCNRVSCPFLHLCSHFINDSCKFKNNCKRSHNIRSEQPLAALKECGFDMTATSDSEILARLKQYKGEKEGDSKETQEAFDDTPRDHKAQLIVPQLCVKYNKFTGCQDTNCRSLHLCLHFIYGNCNYSGSCKRSHNVRSEQPLNLLRGCGLDLAAKSDEQIISLLKQSRSKKTCHTAADERQERDGRRTDKPPASGDREKRVCSFYLSGRCNYGDKCLKYHSSSGVPYQWQYLVSGDHQNADEWRDFAPTTNVLIESRYCDVTEESCETTDDGIGERVRIDFNQRLVFGIGNSEITTEVRRLGTDSAVTSPKRNRYSTVWLWYWQNDDGLWQAFADVETANEDNVGSSSSKTFNDNSGLETRDGAVSFQNEPTSSDIELLYLENQNSEIRYQRVLGSDIVKFLINNLAMMTQTNMNTGASNKLRRRPQLFRKPENTSAAASLAITSAEQKLIYPFCWYLAAIKDQSQDFIRVQLMNTGQTSSEYRGIAGLFEATMPGVAIKTIYRIQNSELWEEFYAFQTRMNRKRSSPARVERLFHGTDRQFVDATCQQGFDWHLNGMSVGAVYGKGSYFAKTAKIAKSYTQTGTMFVVKVIVGEYTKGDGSMVRPPPKDPSKPFQDLYDSCVNDVSNPQIFVVFERRQAYPEYLIEF